MMQYSDSTHIFIIASDHSDFRHVLASNFAFFQGLADKFIFILIGYGPSLRGLRLNDRKIAIIVLWKFLLWLSLDI